MGDYSIIHELGICKSGHFTISIYRRLESNLDHWVMRGRQTAVRKKNNPFPEHHMTDMQLCPRKGQKSPSLPAEHPQHHSCHLSYLFFLPISHLRHYELLNIRARDGATTGGAASKHRAALLNINDSSTAETSSSRASGG